MDNLKQGMISIYLALALRERHITVKGVKDRSCDFVYIDDIVSAVIKSMSRKKGDVYEVYNVSNACKTRVFKIVELIEKSLLFKVIHQYVEGTLSDQMGGYGDNSKIIRDLDWTSKISFKEGMSKMVVWALQIMNIE